MQNDYFCLKICIFSKKNGKIFENVKMQKYKKL